MAFNVIGKTIMRNLFSKPATAMYPIVRNEFYPTTRGEIVYDESTCNYCTLCAKKCPSQAITVDRAGKSWQIDRKRCVSCNFCISVCNKNSLSSAREYSLPIVKEQDTWLFQVEQIAAETMEGVSEEASVDLSISHAKTEDDPEAENNLKKEKSLKTKEVMTSEESATNEHDD